MTSIRVKLRRSTVTGRPGKLFIQVIHNREIKIITTSFKLLPSEWSETEQHVVLDIKEVGRFLDLCAINKELSQLLKSLESIVYRLGRLRNYTVADIIEQYGGKCKRGMMFSFMAQIINDLSASGQSNTATKYKGALKRFSDFRNGCDLDFGRLTSTLVKDYETYLRNRNLTMNSISFYMRILRAVYNRAVKAELAPERLS